MDKQTDRNTNGWTDEQMDKPMYRLSNGQIEIQMDGQMDGQTGGQNGGQTGRQIGGQTDGQTERKIGFL